MKYSEFEREVEKLGFEVNVKSLETRVRRKGNTIVTIDAKHKCIVDTAWDWFQMLTDETQVEIFDLAYQLAKTPLAEREEEKKYRVKFPNVTRGGNSIYLEKKQSSEDNVSVDWSHEDFIFEEPHSYIFTEQEIKDIDERYFLFAEEVKK